MSEAELLEKLESEVLEIKEMIKRLETILIGEEEIGEDEKKELEMRIRGARKGDTVSLDEFLRDVNVQS